MFRGCFDHRMVRDVHNNDLIKRYHRQNTPRVRGAATLQFDPSYLPTLSWQGSAPGAEAHTLIHHVGFIIYFFRFGPVLQHHLAVHLDAEHHSTVFSKLDVCYTLIYF